MTNKRRFWIMFRCSAASALAIATFWFIWSLATGRPVPAITEIPLTREYVVAFPFAVSRWWDVVLGPVWSVLLVALFTSKRVGEDEDLAFGLAAGLVFGLVFGLAFGLAAGLVVGLAFGLVVGLIALTRLIFSAKFWFAVGRWFAAKDKE